MVTIENQNFQAIIDSVGAQLIHLYEKQEDFDYIWNNESWNKHAPVLFPAIGRSNQDKYLLNNKEYKMPQHGFIANQEFKIITHTKNTVTFAVSENTETYKLYPFAFNLMITFVLLSSGLSISFSVKNNTTIQMPFSLGSHPAFNVPLDGKGKFDDYFLEFDGDFQLPLESYEIIKNPVPYRTGKAEFFSENKKIKLSYKLFEKGLRIISNSNVKKVKLFSVYSDHFVIINLEDFANICLWTKETENIAFVCIEPFNGLPDVIGNPVDWNKKESGYKLAPGKTKTMKYEISLK
ncbi:aldose 1-epimerase family protein [Lactobacillus sp. UCMA15818]|nr:aldose 1-epimerase family protein [Lactobacillus sp. UCMA15818]